MKKYNPKKQLKGWIVLKSDFERIEERFESENVKHNVQIMLEIFQPMRVKNC